MSETVDADEGSRSSPQRCSPSASTRSHSSTTSGRTCSHVNGNSNSKDTGYGGVHSFDNPLKYSRSTAPASSLEARGFGKLDLSTLPMEYLQNYPYPAFVLLIPIPPTPTDPCDAKLPFNLPQASAPQFVGTRAFTPVWCNARWDALAKGTSLLDLLEGSDLGALGVWLTESYYSPETARRKSLQPCARCSEGAGLADVEKLLPVKERAVVGIGEHDRLLDSAGEAEEPMAAQMNVGEAEEAKAQRREAPPPLADDPAAWPPDHRSRPKDEDPGSDHCCGAGAGAETGKEPWDRTFRPLTLRFKFPGAIATLDLIRTSMTVHQHDSILGTHSYAIITTVPRGDIEWLDAAVAKRNAETPCPVVSATQAHVLRNDNGSGNGNDDNGNGEAEGATPPQANFLTEHSPVPTFRCTCDGYISYANTAWYELSGYPPDQQISHWWEYIAEGDRARVKQLWETFVADTHSPSISTEWQWTNGRWALTTMIRPEGLYPGSRPGFIGCSVDITERKLNEELQRQRILEAEQRRAEAEEAKRQQELLIDITSHEIRNPISSLMQMMHCSSMVKANLLTLQDKMQTALNDDSGRGMFKPTEDVLQNIAEDLEALDSIYQCGLTQERISNDVLSLSKIQLHMLQMFDVETHIPSFANKLTNIFQYEAKLNRINLTLDIAHDFEHLGLSTIMTDPVRLSQIVTNLLSNAIRFTANRPIRLIKLRFDVRLTRPLIEDHACSPPRDCSGQRATDKDEPQLPTDQDTVFLVVSVSDTGPGLTPAELAMLFQRFSQASPETHTVFGGSGLGLFVCRKIAERMGGRISVVSEYGHGSEFRLYIQAKRASAAAVKRTEMEVDAARTKQEPDSVPTEVSLKVERVRGTALRVLVVEDNPINRTVILRQLTKAGLVTDSANDGLEALTKIRAAMGSGDNEGHSPYDCVLMDIEMPVMDGYTAVRHVRGDEAAGALARSNIIALTGNARQATIDPLMMDFDDVVVKPYRIDNLLSKIQGMVEKENK